MATKISWTINGKRVWAAVHPDTVKMAPKAAAGILALHLADKSIAAKKGEVKEKEIDLTGIDIDSQVTLKIVNEVTGVPIATLCRWCAKGALENCTKGKIFDGVKNTHVWLVTIREVLIARDALGRGKKIAKLQRDMGT